MTTRNRYPAFVNAAVTKEMMAALQERVTIEDRTVSQIVRRALRDYLAKEQT